MVQRLLWSETCCSMHNPISRCITFMIQWSLWTQSAKHPMWDWCTVIWQRENVVQDTKSPSWVEDAQWDTQPTTQVHTDHVEDTKVGTKCTKTPMSMKTLSAKMTCNLWPEYHTQPTPNKIQTCHNVKLLTVCKYKWTWILKYAPNINSRLTSIEVLTVNMRTQVCTIPKTCQRCKKAVVILTPKQESALGIPLITSCPITHSTFMEVVPITKGSSYHCHRLEKHIPWKYIPFVQSNIVQVCHKLGAILRLLLLVPTVHQWKLCAEQCESKSQVVLKGNLPKDVFSCPKLYQNTVAFGALIVSLQCNLHWITLISMCMMVFSSWLQRHLLLMHYPRPQINVLSVQSPLKWPWILWDPTWSKLAPNLFRFLWALNVVYSHFLKDSHWKHLDCTFWQVGQFGENSD